MIDYVTVIYRNYDLLELQIENFKKRFDKKYYNLIVVDNTPDSEKRVLPETKDYKYVYCSSTPTFDGLSHGRAIDYGLTFCNTGIVSIIDSDYFVLNNNIHYYIIDKFEQGYKAVGTEYNDGKDTSHWVNINPDNFYNIPCCFGSYYDINLARAKSWVLTQQEVDLNRSTGFVEVGWKIRKHILDNQIKTLSWQTDATYYGDCYFKNELGDLMGIHYVAGSHRRWNEQSKQDLRNIIQKY